MKRPCWNTLGTFLLPEAAFARRPIPSYGSGYVTRKGHLSLTFVDAASCLREGPEAPTLNSTAAGQHLREKGHLSCIRGWEHSWKKLHRQRTHENLNGGPASRAVVIS